MNQPPRPPPPLWVKPAIGLGLFLAVTITLALLRGEPPASPGAPSPVTWGDVNQSPQDSMPPAPTAPVELEVPEEKTEPGVWVDVKHPDRVRAALFSNEWLQATLKHPLGMGFAGPWAAFLGSKGEDLKASFSGTVLSVFAEQLLASPFQVVWFSGEGRAGPPVLIVRDPPSGAQATFAALDKVARRGVLTAARCPGESGGDSDEQHEVARWLLAEHAVYAASAPGRLVLGRHPLGVLQGLCAELPAPSASDADLEVAVATERLGRDAQALTHALGLEKVLRLQLAADKATFVPRGLLAAVAQPGRLAAAPLSDDLLRAIPEDIPVLLTLQLKLPAALSAESLKRFWSGGQEETITRQVAVLWSPRGDANLPTEVAVLWSRAEDAAALQGIFHGGNTLVARSVCKQQAFASTEELMKRLEAACAGKSPSALAAAPAVLAGLRASSSLALGINLGRLLPQLTLDGYWSETGVSLQAPLPRAAPPEIEQARSDLSLLPFIGFSGSAQEGTWVPGGFRS